MIRAYQLLEVLASPKPVFGNLGMIGGVVVALESLIKTVAIA
jgi:hypothetical protein